MHFINLCLKEKYPFCSQYQDFQNIQEDICKCLCEIQTCNWHLDHIQFCYMLEYKILDDKFLYFCSLGP